MKASPAETNCSTRDDELSAWIAETAQRALAYAITLVRDRTAAEDIVQDCYGRLLAKSNLYDLPRDGAKLLFAAVTNACINWTQRRPPVVSLDAFDSQCEARGGGLADRAEPGPERQAMGRELEEAVDRALAELPVAQRAIVELSVLGHSLVEAAEMLDITHANARVLLHRARKALAARLQPFLEETES